MTPGIFLIGIVQRVLRKRNSFQVISKMNFDRQILCVTSSVTVNSLHLQN